MIFAHRGYPALAPENTLESYKLAFENGVAFTEADTRFTSDGVPVIIHDDTVDRTTDGTGAVRNKSILQILSLDAGSFFSIRLHSS
jgi:glycerophosphoryl diester phosphodiesterase